MNVDEFISATNAGRDQMLRASRRTQTQSFVVMVPRTALTSDVYGLYRSFKRASRDAIAWGGTVHPVDPIHQGHA